MDTKKFSEHRKGNDEASVWHHFLTEKSGQLAKCKKCSKEIKCVGGSTSGLHTHLKTIHGINLKRKCDTSNAEEPSTSKQPKLITSYFKSNKNEELSKVLARMTARDGLSFNTLINSYDIRQGLSARGFENIPKSSNTIRNMVLEYSKIIKNNVISEIANLKSQDKRFSITFDEWTSVRNRRYMNINVHSGQGILWNIGLVRATGSMPADKCLTLVEEKLNAFGLNMSNDIVGVTTDGASVMVKLGKLINSEQQLCFAHGINLAVTDVLYKANSSVIVDKQNFEEEDDDDGNLDEEEDLGGVIIESDLGPHNFNISHPQISVLVTKVRKVVKMFKNSPTKNDVFLQKYVIEVFGKEICLKLDCRTRWNSMLFMLERFYELRFCIKKALIDIGSAINFSDEEFELLSTIIDTLTPIKLGVESLCRKDANLLTADATIKFIITALSQIIHPMAAQLLEAFKSRILKRRTDLSQVLQYLQRGSQEDSEIFHRISKASITKIIVKLIQRLSPVKSDEDKQDIQEELRTSTKNENVILINTNTSLSNQEHLKLKLQAAIEETLATQPTLKKVQGLQQKINDEMYCFEKSGTKGIYLNKVLSYLLTIAPTSVESERAFSAAGQICTKIRSSLNDDTIDGLCFLRAHFNKQ